jgi:hypothetical protein
VLHAVALRRCRTTLTCWTVTDSRRHLRSNNVKKAAVQLRGSYD